MLVSSSKFKALAALPQITPKLSHFEGGGGGGQEPGARGFGPVGPELRAPPAGEN